mmetsp:Transcript_20647/g.58556  ORF Transcript_20647/g.58556 Transcript_20647/m.58556 type:complete len:223 (+) Transcript_20647:57-725(+)
MRTGACRAVGRQDGGRGRGSDVQKLDEVLEAHAPVLVSARGAQLTGELLELLLRHLLADRGEQVLEVRDLHHLVGVLPALLWRELLEEPVEAGLHAPHLLLDIDGLPRLCDLRPLCVAQEVREGHVRAALRGLPLKLPELGLGGGNAQAPHHSPDLLDLDARALLVEELEDLLHLGLLRQRHGRELRLRNCAGCAGCAGGVSGRPDRKRAEALGGELSSPRA